MLQCPKGMMKLVLSKQSDGVLALVFKVVCRLFYINATIIGSYCYVIDSVGVQFPDEENKLVIFRCLYAGFFNHTSWFVFCFFVH